VNNHYALLDIPPTAPADEVKRAFRAQIAKYHPDKVQHLGQEFQAMAANRAAELTEAYRILSDPGRRAEYDAALAAGGAAVRAGAGSAPSVAPPGGAGRTAAATEPGGEAAEPAQAARAFSHERASRDEFVRKAAMSRLRTALHAVASTYDHSEVRGFDVALVPKKKLFGGNKHPKLLGRFVPTVDRAAVADAWIEAAKCGATEEVCVILMGATLAPAGELASEIRDQGRRQRNGGKLVLIPVDARDFDARMPLDAPPIAKTVIERLKKGA
jgi:curved DNA-binding protein CbpA